MRIEAKTPKEYLAALPADRREAIATLRDLVNANLPKGYRETIGYGMIAWVVPLETCPDTYNGDALVYAGLASQKQSMSLYLMTVYGDPATEKRFRDAFAKAGKKLDMGKSCVRFRSRDALHLPAVADAIRCCSVTEYVRRARAAWDPANKRARREAAAKAKGTGKAKPAATKRAAAKAKPTAKKKAARQRDVRAARGGR